MRKNARFLLCVITLLTLMPMALGSAEVLNLPWNFDPCPRPQGEYPARYRTEAWSHYEDPSITADYDMQMKYGEWKITYYMARVKIANGTQLRTAPAGTFDKPGLTSAQNMARKVNAVVAINGDFFSAGENRYVLRQGQVFQENMGPGQDLLLIDEEGDFHILLAEEHPEEMDKTVINGRKVTNAICFGPALIRDGEIVMDPEKAQAHSHPYALEHRAALCQTGPLEYMVVVVANWGLTLEDFAAFVYGLGGVQQAYNLDGAISCQLVFMGEYRSKAASDGQDPRPIPDIIYFGSAWQP